MDATFSDIQAMIDRELVAKGLDRMYDEQVEALSDEAEAFDMIDDMEARVGLDMAEARHALRVIYGVETIADDDSRSYGRLQVQA